MTDAPSTASPVSRHARFRAILEAAAGSSHADYNGYGRFWNLPLPELRAFKLFGIAMMAGPSDPSIRSVAPAPTPSSCCCAPPSAGAPIPSGTDGRRAGLVIGLQGRYPFDGSQYPRLPWGGTPVSADDVAFIAEWIGDGCPGGGEEPASSAGENADDGGAAAALAAGHRPHEPYDGPTNQLADEAGAIKLRKNIAFLTAEELGRYRDAVRKMKALDGHWQDERSFGYWARIHANECQHGWEEFLPWHRAYLYGFEKQLQYFDKTVTLPYWDWAADAEDVKISIEDMGSQANKDNGVVPEAFRCWMDGPGLERLKGTGAVPEAVLDALRGIMGQTFSSGTRLYQSAGLSYGADVPADRAIKAELENINPLWTWRRWPGGNASLIFEAYPTPDDVEAVLTIDNFFTFGSGPSGDRAFGSLENVHNLIHNFSGGANPAWTGQPTVEDPYPTGDMVDPGRTALDPIFWSHHANIDRLWAEWQRRFPGGHPDNPGAILPPFNFTVAETASTRRLGYDYALQSHVFPTDADMALKRFRSADTAVHEGVLAAHRRAEVRLHAIRQVTRPGYFLRVFLNTPHPTLDTRTRGNPNYVGQVSTFTGPCVGGPGHCDTPRPRTDRFDLRHSHHKTPSGFKLDATAAVRALAAAGAKTFTVDVVALNADGSPAADALKLAAVSLDFFD